jgi:hypothetical protein
MFDGTNRPNRGDYCVFCSFGSVKCRPVQADHGCCIAGDMHQSI